MARTLTLSPESKTLKRAQALYEADELDEAFTLCQNILAENPEDAQALTLAAAVLKRGEKTPVAYVLAEKAAALRPDRPEVWVTLGHCAQHLWLLDKAMECYQKALERTMNDRQKATYLNNIGSICLDSGRFTEAEDWVRQSLEVNPDDPLAKHNLGLALLGQQKWSEGWQNYSSSVGTFNRLAVKYRPKGSEEPTWDGTKGQKVVVYGEQGLGDEISFASMIPDVARDAKVILDCDARLKGLFARSFPQVKVYGTRFEKQLGWDAEDREMDASISIGELGKFYRNTAEDFPGTPYLVPCPDRSQGWRAVFDRKHKPCIGIAWSGGTWTNGAKNRFVALKDWQPIFDAVEAHWVCLQYKDAAAEIKGTQVVQYPYATLTKDYDDTAALVSELDLVICMQTTVGHLAGALGKPCWVMVPQNSQWRYGEATDRLPWYDSVRIFKADGKWSPVIDRIATELHQSDLSRGAKETSLDGRVRRRVHPVRAVSN